MKNTLQETYDGFAEVYESNRGAFDIVDILDTFFAAVNKEQGRLLDLGCGAGEPVARFFIDRAWDVTGLDFSARMLELAAKYVPEMKTIHADMCEARFDAAQFDAITATYSLFHIPAGRHISLFKQFYDWLAPGGKILFTYATKAYTGSSEFEGYKTFMGEDLYYSHKTPEALYADLAEIGFTRELSEYRDIGGETFLWVTARKPPGQ